MLIARIAAMVAWQILGVAVAWHLVERTGRALDLGLAGLAQFIPAFGLALFAGHTADRYDRRTILRVTYLAYALLALVLYAYARSGRREIWPIYGVLLLIGTTRAFNQPAGSALAPELVPPEAFTNAVAWNSSFWQLSSIAGPAVGGFATAWLHERVYLVSSVLCVFAFVMTSFIETKPTLMRDGRVTVETVLAGVRYIWSRKLVLGSISLDLFAVLLGGAVALLPLYAKDFEGGARAFGLLRAAPGIGAAITAAVIAYWPLRRHAGALMFACVFIFGLATMGFAKTRDIEVAVVLLFVAGAADMVSVVIRQTLLQRATPPEMRGRVSAVNSVFVGASNELGEFESGVTAEWLGYRLATLVGGIGTCAVVVIWMALFPELRKVDDLDAQR